MSLFTMGATEILGIHQSLNHSTLKPKELITPVLTFEKVFSENRLKSSTVISPVIQKITLAIFLTSDWLPLFLVLFAPADFLPVSTLHHVF